MAQRNYRSNARLRLDLGAVLLSAALVVLTLAGGASFPDALGQPIVRTTSLLLLAVAIGAGLPFELSRYQIPIIFLAAVLAIVAAQLMPLPPELWRSLPGRGALDIGAAVPAVADAWRPLATVPGATRNALFSLAVPVAILLLVTATPRPFLAHLVPLTLAMVLLSSIVAALQFAGSAFDNPVINERLGFASGLLANRNHQALFLSIGVIAAAQWGAVRPFAQVRMFSGGLLAIWFMLMILATGSRTGLILGAVSLLAGTLLVAGAVRRAGVRVSRRQALALGFGVAAVLAIVVGLSFYANRSESLLRLSEASLGDDMRVRALPVVTAMVDTYWPFGAGQGAFEPLFRMAEPDDLLKLTYFNHAHNDVLELLIEGGLPGAILLAWALIWVGHRSWRVWRRPADGETQRARLGSAVFVLVLIASLTDYPARTPLIMAMLVVAVAWLNLDDGEGGGLTKS